MINFYILQVNSEAWIRSVGRIFIGAVRKTASSFERREGKTRTRDIGEPEGHGSPHRGSRTHWASRIIAVYTRSELHVQTPDSKSVEDRMSLWQTSHWNGLRESSRVAGTLSSSSPMIILVSTNSVSVQARASIFSKKKSRKESLRTFHKHSRRALTVC